MTSANNAFVSCLVYVGRPMFQVLCELFASLNGYLGNNFTGHEIIVVNDTGKHVKTQELPLPEAVRCNMILLELSYHHGNERAMMAAAELAVGDYIFEIDYPTPGFPVEILATLFGYAQEHGADIVGGAATEQSPISSRLFYRLARLIGVIEAPMVTEPVRLVSRRALNRTLRERRNTRFRKILYKLSGFRYDHIAIPVPTIAQQDRFLYRLSLAADVVASTSRISSSLAAFLSLVFGIVSLVIGLYGFMVWLLGWPVVPGWTTIIGFLSFGFAGAFFILAMLARMLFIVLNEVQNTEPYVIQGIVRLSNRPDDDQSGD